jgi:predicted nuclease with RNAse H fold
MLKKIVGIDYGAKLAGTTVAAWNENGSLHWKCSGKKQDADKWLEEKLLQLRPDLIFMDAPLSLPGVYSGQGTDYFYREGDRALGAMSPMFLGGLTARAMQLKANLTEEGFQIFETYPARVVQQINNLHELYHKKNKSTLPDFNNMLQTILPVTWKAAPENWHIADAILAWMGGYRYENGIAEKYGNEKEGLIWV